MNEINNYHYYTDLMKNGFYDKLFFIDKLYSNWNTLLDYGCADGFLTKIIAHIFPNKRIIGYDENEKMIQIAQSTGSLPGNVTFSSDKSILSQGDVIFLCSVTHEIHSYKTPEEIEEFYNIVFSKERRYVVIRDMITSYSSTTLWTLAQVNKVKEYCNKMGLSGELNKFENIHGSILLPKSLMHWMFKYSYTTSPNWNREMLEDYMSIPSAIFTEKGYVPDNWEAIHQELYILPYLKHKWRMDFGITGEYPTSFNTHGKFIFFNNLK